MECSRARSRCKLYIYVNLFLFLQQPREEVLIMPIWQMKKLSLRATRSLKVTQLRNAQAGY